MTAQVPDPEELARVVDNPGRLVLAPTGSRITGAFPFGGEFLGYARRWRIIIDVIYRETRDPATKAVVEATRMSVEIPRLLCLLQGPAWSESVISRTFAATTPSSALRIRTPREARMDAPRTPSMVRPWEKIVWVSDDRRGKSLVIRRPLSFLDRNEATAMALGTYCTLALGLVPTPATDENTETPYWQIGMLGNLDL